MRKTAVFTLILGVVGCGLYIAGCSPDKFKEKADKQVYDILDKKWDPNFGEKVNYRVSDVNAGPNDIATAALPVNGIITLADAVRIATAQNRDYLRQKDQLYLAALAQTGVMSVYEPRLFGVISTGYNNNNGTESVDASSEFGIQPLQWLGTGTIISTSIATDWLKFLGSDAPDASLGSVFSASVTQPILRGANPVVYREPLTQAQRNTLYAIRDFNLFRQDFVVGIVRDYYKVLQSLDSVDNAKRSYDSLKISEERVRMLADAGQLPYFEVDQATQETLQVYDQLVTQQQVYEEVLDSFKLRLALPVVAKVVLDPCDLLKIRNTAITEPNYSTGDAITTALTYRLDLANEFGFLEDAKRKVIVAEDALKAGLDLRASMVAPSDNRKPGDIQFDEGNYRVGMDLDLPLERTAERNAYRQTLLSLEEQNRNYTQATDQVTLEVLRSLRQVQASAARYEIQLNSRNLAKRRVENVNMLLLAGRNVTTRDLLDAERSLLDAEDALTSAIVNHTIAKMVFYRDIGILRVRADGMWYEGVVR